MIAGAIVFVVFIVFLQLVVATKSSFFIVVSNNSCTFAPNN